MTRFLWPLYATVAAAAIAAVVLLLREDWCPESESGEHHDLLCFDDTEDGRRTFQQCLHCLRVTTGVVSPWIRRRTHPTPGRSRGW